jgi:hypothetical protein
MNFPFKQFLKSSQAKKSTKNVDKRILGSLGYDKQQEGLPDLEFLSELSPPEGLKRYMKMRYNDPIIGGFIVQLTSVINKLDWTIEGENAEFVKKQLENLACGSIRNFINETSSSFVYGFYIGEKIWKVVDNNIVLQDIIPLFQPTIQAITSTTVKQQTDADYAEIPYKKCVHFVPLSENRSPMGISLLRPLYKPFYYKTAIEASEAIGVDRDLSGLPILQAPQNFDFTAGLSTSPHYDELVADTLSWAIDLVSNIRKDEQQGVVIPFGWDFKLLRGEGSTTVDTTKIITRYNTEMAIGVLEGFLLIGGFTSSNSSDSEVVLNNFLKSCDSYALTLASIINSSIIADICRYNNLKNPPKFTFTPIRITNLTDLASFVARLVAQGVIDRTVAMEKSLLALADLPYTDELMQQKPDPKVTLRQTPKK